MIRCPKCGFEQPPDQYCARCGVNMSTFKPPPIPVTRRLAGSAGFYIFLLASVILASGYWVLKSTTIQQSEIEVLNRITGTTPEQRGDANTESTQPKVAPQVAQSEVTEAGLNAMATPAAALMAKSTSTETSSDVLEESSPTVEKSGTEKSAKLKLVTYFVEVTEQGASALFSGSNDNGTAGVIPDFQKNLKAAKALAATNFRILSQSEHDIEEAGKILRYDQIVNETTGLFVSATPVSSNEQGWTIEVKTSLRIPTQTPTTPPTFETSIPLNSGAAFFIGNIYPRGAQLKPEEAEGFARHQVFKVFTSPAFQSNASEFFVLLHLE